MPLFGTQPDTYPRHQGDEYKYFLENEIYAKDGTDVVLSSSITHHDPKLPVKLIVMPTGFVQIHGRFDIAAAIKRDDTLITLPVYMNLTAIIQIWELGDKTKDLVTENLKVEGNEVKATKDIAKDSDTWGFSGHLLVPHATKL